MNYGPEAAAAGAAADIADAMRRYAEALRMMGRETTLEWEADLWQVAAEGWKERGLS